MESYSVRLFFLSSLVDAILGSYYRVQTNIQFPFYIDIAKGSAVHHTMRPRISFVHANISLGWHSSRRVGLV